MIFDRAGGLHSLLVSAQIALALGWYSVLVAVFSLHQVLAFERYVLYSLVVAVALTFEYFKRDHGAVRALLFRRSLLILHPIALRQTLAVLIALVLFVTLLKDATLSRIFLVVYLATLYPLLLLSSRQLPPLLARRIFQGAREHKTLLVGPSCEVPRVKSWLETRQELGFTTTGIVCDDIEADIVHGLIVFGGTDEIERVVQDEEISQVLILGLPLVLHRHSHVVDVCNRHGVRITILCDLAERLRHAVTYSESDGLHFLSLRAEPLENPRNRLLKRLLDLTVAALAVVLILPWTSALVWLLQRWQSPGPLFHRQVRSGIQNRRFEILKYRTMHDRPHDLTRQATARDERIFPAARWLRKFSIDELPQFINVLRGDMSVVGPRPHLVEHNEQFARVLQQYHIRAYIRPGITGLAQVRGLRGEATTTAAIAARLAADTTYLEHWSFAVDVGIILRTIWQMLCPPKTAY